MQFSFKIQGKDDINIKKIFWNYIELFHASPYLGLYALSEEKKKRVYDFIIVFCIT